MPRLNTPVASRPGPWDRNPVTTATAASATLAENDGTTTRFTYTVPADTKAQLTTLELFILAQIAATTSTTTLSVGNRAQITPSGGASVVVANSFIHSASYAAGDRERAVLPELGILVAGDAILVDDFFQGTADGAGRVLAVGSVSRLEFDA